MISSLREMIEYMKHYYSDRIGFRYYDDVECEVKQVSYEKYCEDVYEFASYLQSNVPVVSRCHIGILSHNSYRYIVCMLGIMIAGGVSVPINPDDTWENIQAKIRFADVKGLLVDTDILRMFDCSSYDALLLDMDGRFQADSLHSNDVGRNINDPCIMYFTSGTTGSNKCAVFSENNLVKYMQEFVDTEKKENDFSVSAGKIINQMLTMPLYHISAISCVLSGNLMGYTTNMCNSLKYIYRDLKYMKSEHCVVVPMLLEDFYKQLKKGKKEKLGGLKSIYCGAASVNNEMFEQFLESGIFIGQTYGLTETFGIGTVNASGSVDKISSVGLPRVTCKLKIENGEVCIKSDAMMLGYYKDEDATREAIQDGWLHTGDLGYLDEDGFLYLTGRKKNLIILSNGENVSAEEIEGEILKNPNVWETVVREKNDKICAVIYCAVEKQEQIRNYIFETNRGKPLWKRITEVEFRAEPFERTGTGKIIRSL